MGFLPSTLQQWQPVQNIVSQCSHRLEGSNSICDCLFYIFTSSPSHGAQIPFKCFTVVLCVVSCFKLNDSIPTAPRIFLSKKTKLRGKKKLPFSENELIYLFSGGWELQCSKGKGRLCPH